MMMMQSTGLQLARTMHADGDMGLNGNTACVVDFPPKHKHGVPRITTSGLQQQEQQQERANASTPSNTILPLSTRSFSAYE